MKKIILAAAATAIATLSFASISEAGYRWHHGHHFNGGINLVLDAGPAYVDDDYGYDDESCYTKKIRKYNRYGELVIKRVRVCG